MLRSHSAYESEANPFASAAAAVPSGLVKLTGRLQQRIDRTLGYFGQGRFVYFYFEPRGEEVVWNDGRSYGFGTGAWRAFGEEVVPLAKIHGVNVGDGEGRGGHVLLVDRLTGQSYFVTRELAAAVVSGDGAGPARMTG